MSSVNGKMDPRFVAEGLRLKLITPDEAARFLGNDHPEPPQDAILIWRVSYFRGTKTEPKWEVFRTLSAAKGFAKKVARYSPNGPGGRVVRVELEECLIKSWAVVEVRDQNVDPEPANTPEQTETVEESTATEEAS